MSSAIDSGGTATGHKCETGMRDIGSGPGRAFVHFVNEKRDKSPTALIGHGAQFESWLSPSRRARRPHHGGEPRPRIHRRGVPGTKTLEPHPHGAPGSSVA